MSTGPETEIEPLVAEEVVVLESVPARSLAERASGGHLPVVQAAAVAAGGFVAGAAVIGLAGRRSRRSNALVKGASRRSLTRHAKPAKRGGAPAELLQIVSSRSVLLDVHLLGVPGVDG